MANGFSLGVLQHIREIAKEATPQYKVEPYGMLASLLTAHSAGVIKNDSFNGHKKTVKVKRKKRFLPSQTQTTPSCDVTNVNGYVEDEVSVSNYRQLAIHVEDEKIAAYDEYASAIVNGQAMRPATPIMFELMDDIMSAASALLTGVNQDLIALANAEIGVNRRTGNNTPASININKSTDTLSLTDGITQILTDFRLNNMKGKPIVVGAGYMHAFLIQQIAKVANQAGLDTRILANGLDFFYDQDFADAVGANNIAVYEKDAIQIVQYLKYQGFKGGTKPGASTFGVMNLPMSVMAGLNEQLVAVPFDFQLRYNDCAEEFTVDGSTTVLEKGYNLIVSKNYGLWTVPEDAYRTGDVLEGNRGSLAYEITNECDPC